MTDVHEHPFALRAVVVQGEMRLTTGGETHHLQPGDEFALAQGVPHAEGYGPEGAIYWVRAPNREAVIGALRQPVHRVSARASRCCARKRFSSSALLTTDTLDSAIAAPANTGVSTPSAASGMPTML